MTKSRRSYRYLMLLPGWGLYLDSRLVATIAAETAYVAREIFRAHGLVGDRVRRLPD